MSFPGGIRTTLAVALLVIVGGALGGAYLMVVPSLERQLVDARIDQLEEDGLNAADGYPLIDQTIRSRSTTSPRSPRPSRRAGRRVPGARARAADAGDAGRLGTARRLHPKRPRREADRGDVVALPRPCRAAGAPVRRVGVPLLDGNVLLLSASIEDQLATVRVVKRRLLYATGVALLIAAILGSAAATVHARRIRRLERAANRIAEGQFDEPVVDLGDDELGELAAAFERMRVQLSQLDTARKEFVANASHELRTPLFSLAGFLELMADEDLDEKTRAGFLVTTREQVERLTKLAADLLDLSRMDAGRLRVEQEEVVLADVARIVAEELSPLAESTGHRLAVDVGPRGLGARGRGARAPDRARAGRNALMHTPTGTEVRISADRRDGRAELTVADDGPGVAPEHAERIFDRFYRVEGPQASGSGLGLAIARELAERMNGTVELVSAPGATRFTLSLPAAAVRSRELAVFAVDSRQRPRSRRFHVESEAALLRWAGCVSGPQRASPS